MTTRTTFTIVPWNGGQANVTAANAERPAQAKSPMTKLARGTGWVRYSADGQYRYEKEEHLGWFVQHVPSGTWITDLAGLELVGFSSCAAARRWTAQQTVAVTA